MAGYVTVSIDDGAKRDQRVAAMLSEHGLRATFYIPTKGPRELNAAEIRSLDEDFEIGSHGFSHVALTTISAEAVTRELRDSKAWLEQLLGHEVTAFCYPYGKFNREISELVEREGFACARTCLLNRTDLPGNPYRFAMTTDALRHAARAQIRHGLREANLRGLRNYLFTYRLERDWEVHFQRALDIVSRDAGMAHLVVHTEEVDKRDEWEKLDRVLRAAAAAGLTPATNSEVLATER